VASFGHPSEFQRVLRLGSVTAVHGTLVVGVTASVKLWGVEQRALPIFGRASITLGIGPQSSLFIFRSCDLLNIKDKNEVKIIATL